MAARALGEREDDLGVDGRVGLGAGDPVLREELVVVLDDPVVDPDDRAVPDRVVVRGEARMTLRVVADVDEELGRVLGHADPLEQRGRS